MAALTCTFALNTQSLIVQRITRSDITLQWWSIIPLAVVAANGLLSFLFNIAFDPATMAFLYFVVAVAMELFFWAVIIRQFTTYLGIDAFRIRTLA